MGNTEGNAAIESERSISHVESFNRINKEYLCSGNNQHSESRLVRSFHGKVSRASASVRGEVIAFSANRFLMGSQVDKTNDAVDLRIAKCVREKTGEEKHGRDEIKSQQTRKISKSAEKIVKLKFGIENILKNEVSCGSEHSFAADVQPGNPEIVISKPSASSSRNCTKDNLLPAYVMDSLPPPTSLTSGGRNDADADAVKRFFANQNHQGHNYTNKLYNNLHVKRYSNSHPYSPYDARSHARITSDNAIGSTKSPQLVDERFRRRSESPRRRIAQEGLSARKSSSFTTNTQQTIDINHRRADVLCQFDRFLDARNAARDKCLSPGRSDVLSHLLDNHGRSKSVNSSPFECRQSIDKFSKSEKNKMASTGDCRNPINSHNEQTRMFSIRDHFENIIKNKRSSSESDDVFNDDVELSHRTSPLIHPISPWKPRHYSSNEEHLMSPECSNVFDHRRGATSFFPSMTNRASSFPPPSRQINLNAWHVMAANCHPVLRPLVYPYAYGHNAATAAVAMAAMRSQLKNITSPPGMTFTDNSASIKSVNKNCFGMQDVVGAREQSYGEKTNGPRKRRKWSRAVFSLVQRRGLEKSFQVQKYVAKPERRGLAEALGLTDAQVKIWFQNRRMKWRQEQKNNKLSDPDDMSPTSGGRNFNQIITQGC